MGPAGASAVRVLTMWPLDADPKLGELLATQMT
jgi:hypothetical protein